MRLCVLVRELCKYRFRAAFGVWVLWCGGAPFGRFPSRLRRRGAHLGGGGGAVGRQGRVAVQGGSAFAFALPHPALGASPISGRGRGGRQAAAGRMHGQGRGWPGALPPLRTVIRHTSGMVRHCARGRLPLPSPSPTLRTAARDTVAQRRGLFSGATRTLPGSGLRANDILYIRVRRREGEHVLHRAAGNNVDNFSVDNPLWITAAAGGRLLCGGRGRLCGGSVNAGTPFRSQGCDFTTWTGGRIYNNTRARELLRRKCVKPADLTTHSPPKTSARSRTATRTPRTLPLAHAAPTHARRLRDARPQCAMHSPLPLTTHSPPKTSSRPRTATRPPRALLLPHATPTHARRLRDAFPADRTTHSPQRHAASPSVPLRAQKNGTAQCMCDAECFGRPSLRSVIWVGEPRAVCRRCGALACRRGA